VSRKAGKSHRRPAKPTASDQSDQTMLPLPPPDKATLPLLPMEIQVGDRFTDEEGEWEVVSRPATLHGAKRVRARVRRTEPPAAERDVTWPAHVRVEIRRTR
jgi:hypothetical protein